MTRGMSKKKKYPVNFFKENHCHWNCFSHKESLEDSYMGAFMGSFTIFEALSSHLCLVFLAALYVWRLVLTRELSHKRLSNKKGNLGNKWANCWVKYNFAFMPSFSSRKIVVIFFHWKTLFSLVGCLLKRELFVPLHRPPLYVE